jgi:hypothetical protein
LSITATQQKCKQIYFNIFTSETNTFYQVISILIHISPFYCLVLFCFPIWSKWGRCHIWIPLQLYFHKWVGMAWAIYVQTCEFCMFSLEVALSASLVASSFTEGNMFGEVLWSHSTKCQLSIKTIHFKQGEHFKF